MTQKFCTNWAFLATSLPGIRCEAAVLLTDVSDCSPVVQEGQVQQAAVAFFAEKLMAEGFENRKVRPKNYVAFSDFHLKNYLRWEFKKDINKLRRNSSDHMTIVYEEWHISKIDLHINGLSSFLFCLIDVRQCKWSSPPLPLPCRRSKGPHKQICRTGAFFWLGCVPKTIKIEQLNW